MINISVFLVPKNHNCLILLFVIGLLFFEYCYLLQNCGIITLNKFLMFHFLVVIQHEYAS